MDVSTSHPEQSTLRTYFNLKYIALAFVGIVILAAVLSVLSLLSKARSGVSGDVTLSNTPGSYGGVFVERAMYDRVSDSAVAPQATSNSVGSYAETPHETHEYRATIKTAAVGTTCDTIEGWKLQRYVLFETAERSERSCVYNFKVERAYAPEVLTALQALNPTTLRAQTTSVQKQAVMYQSELDVLLRKQELLEDALTRATGAYDELAQLSKDAQDVSTLAKVIDSKLALIERLSRERQTLATQIGGIARSSAALQERVVYTYFAVNVDTSAILDRTRIRLSWVQSLSELTQSLNVFVQYLTVRLIGTLLVVVQVVVYVSMVIAVLLYVGKYGWRSARTFWNRP